MLISKNHWQLWRNEIFTSAQKKNVRTPRTFKSFLSYSRSSSRSTPAEKSFAGKIPTGNKIRKLSFREQAAKWMEKGKMQCNTI